MDPDVGAVQEQSSGDQPTQNNDTNQEPAAKGKRSVCTYTLYTIGVIVCLIIWCGTVLAVLVNSIVQENIFSVLYLGITCVYVATMKQKVFVSIAFKILCGVLWAVVLAGKIAFQVLYCNDNEWVLQRAFDVPIFGMELSRHNSTFTKLSCPLDTWYKDILWDLLAFLLSLAAVIIFGCKYKLIIEEWNTRFKKCDDVARQFMDTIIGTNPDTRAQYENLKEALRRYCVDWNEQNLYNYFRVVPAAKDTKSAYNKNLNDKESLKSTRSLLFDNHYSRTIFRTLHAFSGINLQVACNSEQNQPVDRKSREGGKRTISDLSRTSTGSNEPQNGNKTKKCKCLTWSEWCFCFASGWPIICYIIMILYTTLEGNVLSLVYPAMIFFWALLTSGRFHIWFWIAVTLYTLALMIVKIVFEWPVIHWNTSDSEDIFYWPRIIGLEKYSAVHPVILLAALFIQCCIFKCYGTWDTSQQVQHKHDHEQGMQDIEQGQQDNEQGQQDNGQGQQDNEKGQQDNEQGQQDNEQGMQDNEQGQQDNEQGQQDNEQGQQDNEQGQQDNEQGQQDIEQGQQDIEQPAQNQNTKKESVPSTRTPPDLYWCALVCDIIILFVLLLLLSTPGEGGNLIKYLTKNSVPWSYVIISLVYFGFIIVERALYILGCTRGKCIFHCILMLGLHVAVFYGLPKWHQKSFNQMPPAQGVYFVRCFSFAISAYQIKNGYPRHEHVHVSTKTYSWFNKVIFKCYLAVPFLMEIRTLLGWMCTKTCLSLRQWFQCEDIYTSLYIVKSQDNKTDASEKQSKIDICKAWFFLVVLIFLPWLPMIVYSVLTEETNSNPPTAATLTVSIGGYQPLFQTTATKGRSILPISEADLESLIDSFGRHTEAGRFLRGKNVEDMSLVKFDGVSLSTWGISKNSLNSLYNDLTDSAFSGEFQFVVEVRFKRDPDEEHYSDMTRSFPVNLRHPAYTEAWGHLRNNLNLNSTSNSSEVVTVNAVFPRFIHLGRHADVSPESRLFEGHHGMGYSNLSLKYFRDNNPYASWWELQEVLKGSVFHYEENGDISLEPTVYFITFNDKIASVSFISLLKGVGIIALYTGVIWAISGVVRGLFTENHATLMFRKVGSVDPLLRLVEALYNTIEQKDLKNQRLLYEILTSLYADPKRMKEFTSAPSNSKDALRRRCYSDATSVKAPRASGLIRLVRHDTHKRDTGSEGVAATTKL